MVEVDLLIQSEAGELRRDRLQLDSRLLSIGRHARNTVCLESDRVSRHHARVELMQDRMHVEDSSSNGTVAGGVVLHGEGVDVPYGTPIKIGEYTLRIMPRGAAAAHTSSPQALPATYPKHVPVPAAEPSPPLPPAAAPPAHLASGPHAAIPAPHAPAPHAPAAHAPAAPAPAPHTPPAHAPAAAPSAGAAAAVASPAMIELRREIHRLLLENLDLAKLDPGKMDDPSMRPRVLTALRRIVRTLDARIPAEVDRDVLVGELADEALGLGPLERFLADPNINEIMVVDPNTIYVEMGGRLVLTDARFTDDERVRAVIERIVTPLGRRIDESSPLVDARLKDGSRVNAVIRPLALRGSCITIRRFARTPLTLDRLVGFGALTPTIGRFLVRAVTAKKNVVISGGTGSGKTTLLNVLSAAIPESERIVTIEDAAELQLHQPHVVSLETRPANMEGRGEYTIRDLVRNALRMRPDRIVVGECRGGEALDMLQAMNTGHDGSLTTTHANSPREALGRIETLALMGGIDLPSRAIREQIANSIHLIVQVARLSDGTRKVTSVSEVAGLEEEDGTIEERPIFEFVRHGTGKDGAVLGEFRATGYLPSFLDQFIVMGLVKPGEPYL